MMLFIFCHLALGNTKIPHQFENGKKIITSQILELASDVDMPVNVEWQGNKAILKSEAEIRTITFSDQEIESAKMNEVSDSLMEKISASLAGEPV